QEPQRTTLSDCPRAKGTEPYGWSFPRNFFQPKAECSISKSSITLPPGSTTKTECLSLAQSTAPNARRLLPLLGIIHSLPLLPLVFASLGPAFHRSDMMAFLSRLSMTC